MEWIKNLLARNKASKFSASDLVVGNAENKRNDDPRFFSIPRREQRLSREVGDEVMICIQSPEALPNGSFVGENVWVKIIEKSSSYYVGLAEDSLKLFPEMENLKFTFGPECIAGARLPSTHVLPYMKSCLASKAVIDTAQWPVFACRMPAQYEDDSGWRIYAKDESVSDTTEAIQVHQLISKFQVLDSILDEPDVATWIWREDLNEYNRQDTNKT